MGCAASDESSSQSKPSPNNSNNNNSNESKEQKFDDIQNMYIFQHTLGKGASCRVVEAIDRNNEQRRLAIKIMSKDKAICKQLFKHEVGVLSQIQHQNIIHFIDSHEDKDNYYVLTALCSGGELFDRIVSSDIVITEKDASRLIRAMLLSIQYLHNKDIVHRDLKPENFVFETRENDANIVLIDFGCAKIVNDQEVYKDLVGTVYYLAPELAAQSSKVPRTGKVLKYADIWSIGVISYVMLTGRPPFKGKSNPEIFTSIIRSPLRFPTDIELSDGFKDFVMKVLVKNPYKRMSIEDALRHPWVQGIDAQDIALNKDVLRYLKQFNYQSKLKKAITACLAQNMSSEPELEVRRHFNRLDNDGNGVLDAEELEILLQDMGFALSRLKIESLKMMKAADVDGDGVISFDEFKRVWHRKLLSQHEQYVHRVFAVFDDNGDGYIDARELQGVVGDSLDDVLAMIKEVDDDDDGRISFEEFQKAMMEETEKGNDPLSEFAGVGGNYVARDMADVDILSEENGNSGGLT